MATISGRDREGKRSAEEAFSEASRLVSSGRSVESVLALFPENAAEFEPLLRLTLTVRDAPRPVLSPHALNRIRDRAQAAVEERDTPKIFALPQVTERVEVEAQQVRRRSWLETLFSSRRALAVALPIVALLVVGGILLSLLVLKPDGVTRGPLEQYSGIITRIEGNEWLIGDDTEVVIDATTEIHGQPAVGAEMSCIAVRLPGRERFRALEVWIKSGPGTPTVAPDDTSGWHIFSWYLSRE